MTDYDWTTELPDAVDLLRNRLDRALVDRLDKGDFAAGLLEYLRNRPDPPLLFSPERLGEIARLARQHDPEEFAWEKEIADHAREGRLYGASNPYCRRFLDLDREAFDFSAIEHFDPETIHGLNRMRWLRSLAANYWVERDPSYYRALQREWDFFVAKVPLPDASFYPELSRLKEVRNGPPYSELDTFIRLHNWYWAYWLSVFAPEMTPERNAVLLARCLKHFDLVAAEGVGRHEHNFTSMQMESLYLWSASLPEASGMPVWQHASRNIMEMSLARAVYNDGAQWEKSFGYHQGCVRWYGVSFLLGKRIGQPWAHVYGDRLQKMGHFIDAMVTPDGNAPLMSDSDRKPGWGNALALLRCTFPDITFRRPVGPTWSSLWVSDGMTWQPDSVVAPADPVTVFDDAGVAALLSSPGRQATQLILDNGPTHAGHSHKDNLTIHYEAFGRPVVVDPGRWVYTRDADRAWVCSPNAHNTVCIEDVPVTPEDYLREYCLDIFQPHDPRLDAVRVDRFGEVVRVVSGHRGFKADRTAHVERTVFTTLDEAQPWLVVVDRASAPSEHTWTTGFLFPTDAAAERAGESMRVALAGGPVLTLRWLSDDEMTVRDQAKFWCPNYAEKSPARWIRFSSSATQILRAFALVPRMIGQGEVDLRREGPGVTLIVDGTTHELPMDFAGEEAG